MGRVLAGRVGAIVTAGAIARDVHMIKIRRQPADGGMTIITIIAAGYVGRMLASRDHTVMAGATSPYYLGVVDGESGSPQVRRVAVFADIACLNMSRRFACSFYAVMAAYAVPGDIHVVKIRRQPGDRGMTVVAGIVAIDMGRMLACCREPIMTGAAGTQDLRMVHGISRRPDIAVMTVFTHISRLYVGQVFAGSVNAIVTTRAVPRDVQVIEIRWSPGVC